MSSVKFQKTPVFSVFCDIEHWFLVEKKENSRDHNIIQIPKMQILSAIILIRFAIISREYVTKIAFLPIQNRSINISHYIIAKFFVTVQYVQYPCKYCKKQPEQKNRKETDADNTKDET